MLEAWSEGQTMQQRQMYKPSKARWSVPEARAYHNIQEESTAFGSEYEMTTVTQTLPNQHDAVRGVEESSVPGEVIIMCQEIEEA